ncbi:hypothetical protein [Bradyrhizobium sp. CB3481]|uniref:hypothetical protein n=1 Tax=Bradyrhizobium sp. CB3481 TaxID=3039158 RepID=UPI0024B118CC|nr:hypothetical protein [Bradyrhizobium sp. CB3481]WFU19430.1 hypothetical protein QA643_14410 [Bradyrhizobium sp. CB3481]
MPKVVTRDLALLELCDLFERDDFNAYPVEENLQVISVVSKLEVLARFALTHSHIMPRYEDLMKIDI